MGKVFSNHLFVWKCICVVHSFVSVLFMAHTGGYMSELSGKYISNVVTQYR